MSIICESAYTDHTQTHTQLAYVHESYVRCYVISTGIADQRVNDVMT